MKDEVVYIHGAYRVVFGGKLLRPNWLSHGGAVAAFDLLKSGKGDVTAEGDIRWHTGVTVPPDEVHTPPASYRVAVKTRADKTKWVYNQLRFARALDAAHYGAGLKRRWPDVVEVDIQPTNEPPNATYPVPSDRYLTAERIKNGEKR